MVTDCRLHFAAKGPVARGGIGQHHGNTDNGPPAQQNAISPVRGKINDHGSFQGQNLPEPKTKKQTTMKAISEATIASDCKGGHSVAPAQKAINGKGLTAHVGGDSAAQHGPKAPLPASQPAMSFARAASGCIGDLNRDRRAFQGIFGVFGSGRTRIRAQSDSSDDQVKLYSVDNY